MVVGTLDLCVVVNDVVIVFGELVIESLIISGEEGVGEWEGWRRFQYM